MKKGLSIILVLVMSIGAMAAAVEPTSMSGPNLDSGTSPPTITLDQSTTLALDSDAKDPMTAYIRGLDPTGPRFPPTPVPGEPLMEDGSQSIPPYQKTDAIFLYEDPMNDGEWLPFPTRDDIYDGTTDPVSIENDTLIEIHGKLFERIPEPNITYYDDIGIPYAPIKVEFDGTPVTMSELTGNNTTVIEPFIGTGNGTFKFLLDINKPAGEYELNLVYNELHTPYMSLNYTVVAYVNHPTHVNMDVTPTSVTVGNPVTVSGKVADDTGRPISSVGLQVWFDNVLLGTSSDGVYLDDVRVSGADFFDDFEDEEGPQWSSFTAPGRGAPDQWARGSPSASCGPTTPRSGSNLYGTNLDRDYDRGAWSFLVTPGLNFSVDEEYILSFYSWWSVDRQEDYCYIIGSLDGGASWDDVNPMTFMGATLVQNDWTYYEFNVTKFVGSDNVKFAFVFYAVDKTLDARHDGKFAYQHVVPMSTTADRHRIDVTFQGNLLFGKGASREDIDVRRITHLEYGTNFTQKVGYRNSPVRLVAYLRDNMGEIPSPIIRGQACLYQATMYWDRTWTIADGIGEQAGPPRTMVNGTGELSIDYVVSSDQTLGPANVTFRFPGSDYYTAYEGTDVYYVKAHVHIVVPPDQERVLFRGMMFHLEAELRIVPEEAIDNIEPGDPISGEFIKVFWGNQPIGNRRTQFDGTCSIDYLVPSTHPLGDVVVMFIYMGNSLYEEVTLLVNYTVMSETVIDLPDQVVFKGSWAYINGTITDDKRQPVANVAIDIIWRRLPDVAGVTSEADGTFSFAYYLDFYNKAENVLVSAKFAGSHIYLANETVAIFTVKVGTLLVRRDTVTQVVPGEEVELSVKLYEDWDGVKGVEVQRELVMLSIDGEFIEDRRTAFDGSVVFKVFFDPEVYRIGVVEVRFLFAGSEFYEPSENVRMLSIGSGVLVSFDQVTVNGRPIGLPLGVVRRDDVIQGRVLVKDGEDNPLPDIAVSISFREDGPSAEWQILRTRVTDASGMLEFALTLQFSAEGRITFRALCDEIPTAGAATYEVLYIVPPSSSDALIVEVVGVPEVRTGSTLSIDVRPINPGDWNVANLVYSLVSQPEGMEISPSGFLTWTPGEDLVGKHNVTVWLYDGTRSETTPIVITVSEEGMTPVDADGGPFGWLVGILVVVVILTVVLVNRRRSR